MIDHVKKSKPAAKNNKDVKNPVVNALDFTYDPELDKFTGKEYVPEKHKEDEIRMANSVLPPRLSSSK